MEHALPIKDEFYNECWKNIDEEADTSFLSVTMGIGLISGHERRLYL